MDRHARVPGPAQDALNKLFAPHLPNVAPPPNQPGLYLPHSGMEAEGEDGGGASAYAASSGTSTPGQYGAVLNLEAVGGKIEGWMRKVATRTAAAWEAGGSASPARSGREAAALVGVVPAGGGVDLIEMNDAFEIGGDDTEEQREREVERVQAQRGRQVVIGASSGRESGSGMRPRARSGAGAGKGKED